MTKMVKIEVSAQELDDIANGLGLYAASLKRAANAERDIDVRTLREKSHARVIATISRLTNLPLDL